MTTRNLPPPNIPVVQANFQSSRGWREYWEWLDKWVKSIGEGAEARLVFEFHGGGFVLSSGTKVWLRVPFDCEILSWTATAQPSGSVQVALWRDTYANFPPTIADVISASAPVTISSSVRNTNSTLTGWNKDIPADHYILANINSVSTIQDLVIELQVKKT